MTDGFSAAERAAMKERAADLRAEGRLGAKEVDGLQAVLDRIAAMPPEDRHRAGPSGGRLDAAEPAPVAGMLSRVVLRGDTRP